MTCNRALIAILLVAVAMAGGCAGTGPRESPTPTLYPTPIVPVVPSYEVLRGDVTKVLEFRGRVVPVVEEELSFRASGYVGTVYVQEDDTVEAGDLLADLETTDLVNQLAQAEVDLRVIRAAGEQSIAEAEVAVRIARLRLEQARENDGSQQVVVAEVGVNRAQAALEKATADRQAALNAEGESDGALAAAADKLRTAELDLRVAEALYGNAVQMEGWQAYNVLILEQEVMLAQLRLVQAEQGLDLQQADLKVRRLEDQLADARVVAPFDGQVVDLYIREGQAVDGHRTVMVVADPNRLEVGADLSSADQSGLPEGMPATVFLVHEPSQEWSGQIRRVPGSGSGGGSVRVSLEDKDDGSVLGLGTVMQVTVVLDRREGTLWLPPQAIRAFEGRKFVVVQEDGAQKSVDVKVGLVSEDRVEIEEGLTEGQIVYGY
jgi:RND family efflux transporter MFP subunit